MSEAKLETGQSYHVYLCKVDQVNFEVLQVQFYSWSDNIKYLKNKKEKYGKIEIFVSCRHVWISVGSSYIFLKVLKLPINSYFCPPDRIILSRLKKIRKNMEKSKIFFYGVGFGYR